MAKEPEMILEILVLFVTAGCILLAIRTERVLRIRPMTAPGRLRPGDRASWLLAGALLIVALIGILDRALSHGTTSTAILHQRVMAVPRPLAGSHVSAAVLRARALVSKAAAVAGRPAAGPSHVARHLRVLASPSAVPHPGPGRLATGQFPPGTDVAVKIVLPALRADHAMLPQALLLLVVLAGLVPLSPGWLVRLPASLRRPVPYGRAGTRPWRWALLLLPVAAMISELLGMNWALPLDRLAVLTVLTVLVLAAGLAVRWPAAAADLAVAGLIGIGLCDLVQAVAGPVHVGPPRGLPGLLPGVVNIAHVMAIPAGIEGVLLGGFGLWLIPRTIAPHVRALLGPGPDEELTQRVEELTQTRAVAVDTAATDLQRLERDLHDGAQARLVAIGMSLRAAERLIATSPQAATELVAEARQAAGKALTELRGS
jgi:signal transduction histidine kinase